MCTSSRRRLRAKTSAPPRSDPVSPIAFFAHFLIAPRPNLFRPEQQEDEDDEEEERGRKKKKKKRTGASAFIDDMAEEEDADDDDDEDDEGEEEDLDEGEREAVELEAQQRIHARYQNMENMERMENEEELEKQIKERYAAHMAREFDGDVVGSVVDQQALHPTVRDPKLWLVTVKQGKERETVVCLMQKAINLHKSGKGSMAIKSACVQDHLKSYIYVEAERESDVKKALQGMRHVYHSKPIKLVPITEMVDSITVTKKKVENIQYQSWVRMRGGVYKGDLARVIDINYADNQCTVQLVPRFDYALLQAKEEGTAAGRAKPNAALPPPARLFTEAEARKYNLSLERGRMDRRTGDRLDILCGASTSSGTATTSRPSPWHPVSWRASPRSMSCRGTPRARTRRARTAARWARVSPRRRLTSKRWPRRWATDPRAPTRCSALATRWWSSRVTSRT